MATWYYKLNKVICPAWLDWLCFWQWSCYILKFLTNWLAYLSEFAQSCWWFSLETTFLLFCSDILNGCQWTDIKTTLVALWISLLIPNIEIAKHLSLNIFSGWCNCGGPNSILKGVSTQLVSRNGGPNRTLSRAGLCFHFSQWALLSVQFTYTCMYETWSILTLPSPSWASLWDYPTQHFPADDNLLMISYQHNPFMELSLCFVQSFHSGF